MILSRVSLEVLYRRERGTIVRVWARGDRREKSVLHVVERHPESYCSGDVMVLAFGFHPFEGGTEDEWHLETVFDGIPPKYAVLTFDGQVVCVTNTLDYEHLRSEAGKLLEQLGVGEPR